MTILSADYGVFRLLRILKKVNVAYCTILISMMYLHQINMNFTEVSYEGEFLWFTFEINGALHLDC